MIETSSLRRKLLQLAVTGKLSADGRARSPSAPHGWKMVKLGEISRQIGTKQHQIQTKEIIAWGKYPVVSQGQGLIDGYSDDEDKSISDLPLILFGDHTKNVKFIDFEFVVGADGTKLFAPNDGVDAKWLYYFTTHAAFEIGDRGYGRHWGLLNKLPIPLPPLAEQKAIVKRLEALLALEREIAADTAALDDLITAAKKKILDLAISGELVPKKGEWKTISGHDIFEATETRLPSGRTFRYIDIDAIDNKRHVVLEPKEIDVSEAPSRASRGVQSGDTLFSLVRPYLENIAYITESLQDCIASTGFYVCRPSELCDSRYVYWMMLSPSVLSGLNQHMKGDNSPSIRQSDILNFKYPLPPLAEQKAIVAKVEELFAVLDAMRN